DDILNVLRRNRRAAAVGALALGGVGGRDAPVRLLADDDCRHCDGQLAQELNERLSQALATAARRGPIRVPAEWRNEPRPCVRDAAQPPLTDAGRTAPAAVCRGDDSRTGIAVGLCRYQGLRRHRSLVGPQARRTQEPALVGTEAAATHPWSPRIADFSVVYFVRILIIRFLIR